MYNLFYITLIFIFIGCGGGGGGSSTPSSGSSSSSDSSDSNPSVKSAQFIDSAVEGLYYSCRDSSSSGVTDSNGTLVYDENCGELIFKIGTVVIGKITNVNMDGKIFITDLFDLERSDTNDTNVTNLARFLQSLDSDDDPSNGILITDDINNSLDGTSLDFNTPPMPTINDINDTIVNTIGKTLVSKEDAVAHLDFSLNNLLYVAVLEEFSINIDENITDNTHVGDINISYSGNTPITSFTIIGTGSSNFEINATGALKVATGATIDYESETSFSLAMYATNSKGNSEPVNLIININNIAEIVPTLTTLTTSVTETAANGTLVGTIAVDTGDTAITNFELNETNGSLSTIFNVSNSGVITVLDNSTIDYETTPSYGLVATAYNDFGSSNSVDINISISNTSDTVPTLENLTVDINENSTDNTTIADINISNNGDSAISSIAIKETNGTISSIFEILNSGTIKLKSGQTVDYETRSSYDLRATASNNAGDSSEATISININDLTNEIISIIEPLSVSIDENITDGTHIANVNESTPGDSNITSFTISGTGSSNFDINSTGALKVASGASIDYEYDTSFALTMFATNDAGNSIAKDLNITINNISDIIPIISNFTTSIDENVSIGFDVGNIIVTDTGDGAITSFTLSDTSNFDINTSGYIVTNTTLDYETTNEYNLTVFATNDAGNSLDKNITITINDTADIVPIVSSFTTSIDENVSIGFAVGNIIITNSGDTAITSFTLSDTSNFDINTSGYLVTNTTFDYETTTEYNLTVYATNSAGDSNTTVVNIGINNIIDEVAIVNNFTANIDENTEGGTILGTLNITQGDSSITLIDLNNTDGSISSEFEIDTSGVVTLKADISLDYETKSIYSLTTRALNTAGYSNEAIVTININDVNSSVPILYDFTTTLNSVHTAGYTVGQINIEQGDGAITSISITGGTHGDNFNISNDGIIVLSDDVNLTDTSISNYTFTVKATNEQGNSNEVTITINMTYDVDLYIQSSVYDNNNTASIDDDNLYIYFNSQIDESSFTASLTDSFTITGTGEIGSGSTKVCDDSLYHLCTIKQDPSTGSTEIIPIITQIKIAQNTITDVNGSDPSSYINTTIEQYQYILKTGQINSFDENGSIDSSIKDDNSYSKGWDRNFTRDDANEIVNDNSLIFDWQDNNDTNAEDKTWDDSVSYCDNLILNGDDDWRLPTRKEFFLILNKNNYDPALENVFINHNVSTYWTSTKDANDNTKAWKIYIEYGRNLSRDITTTSNVKCIRN